MAASKAETRVLQFLSVLVCILGLLSLVTVASGWNRAVLRCFFVLAGILSSGLAYIEFSKPQARVSVRTIRLHPYVHNIAVFVAFAYYPTYSIGVLVEATAYHFAVFCFVSDLHVQTTKDFSQISLSITHTLARLDPLIVLELLGRILYYHTQPYLVDGLVYLIVGTMFRAMISEPHRSPWRSIYIPIENRLRQSRPGIVRSILQWLEAFADAVHTVAATLWPVSHQTMW
jgi:hypothetical protein